MRLSPQRKAVIVALSAGERLTSEQIDNSLCAGSIFANLPELLGGMVKEGALARVKEGEQDARWTLTHKGLILRAKLVPGSYCPPPPNLVPPPTHAPTGTYAGHEMRPFQGRAGAMDAYRLPSRGIDAR